MTPRTAPTVSVVVPVRDDAAALDRCLARIARQTVAPLEVVVVDNASRDDSALVARRWGAVVVREERVGIPAAAATGYDAARGDVIARLDADSLPDPGWVQRVVDRMAADPTLDAMTGTGTFDDLPRGARAAVAIAYLGAYYVLCHLALGHTALWGSCMALRRSACTAVRDAVVRDDPEVHDDLDLSFRLGPGRRTVLDRSWRVGVSARSLRGRRQRRRRMDRAWRTLRVNWAVAPPGGRGRAPGGGPPPAPPPPRPAGAGPATGRRRAGDRPELSPRCRARCAAASRPGPPRGRDGPAVPRAPRRSAARSRTRRTATARPG
ncbi:MAG: glycosyltransferase family 2 protein [Cellulosimicrobium funkei]